MSRYLLDTDVLIDYSKGREPATSLLQQIVDQGDELGVSPVTVTEFFAGIPPERRDHWHTVISTLEYWEPSLSAAQQAGEWLYDYARQGLTLGTADTMIAAVAVEAGATLLTRNAKDYPMPGVPLQQPE